MKSLGLSYFLCILAFFTPAAGLHRFYLEKPLSGLLYLFTWGFFGIGTIIDLIRMPIIVDQINFRLLTRGKKYLLVDQAHFDGFTSPERQILKIAKKHGGVVTIQMVSLDSSMSLSEAKNELEQLREQGFCEKDVDESGAEIFTFNGLEAKKPILG